MSKFSSFIRGFGSIFDAFGLGGRLADMQRQLEEQQRVWAHNEQVYLNGLIDRCETAMKMSSRHSEMRSSYPYTLLCHYGSAAVPSVVARIRSNPSWLVLALHDISGVDPTQKDSHGYVQKCVDDWIEWYDKQDPETWPTLLEQR